MKIVILCGGEGTRLKEETEFKPKPMVEVGGMPILWHIMKIYSAHGFNDFVLPLGYKGNMIKEYFLHWKTELNDFELDTESDKIHFFNKGHDSFKITFVETGEKSLTGERIRRVAEHLKSEDEFMVTYGDGVANVDIQRLLDFHHKQNTIGTITGVHPATRFGLIEKDEATKKIKGFHQVTIVSMSHTGNVKEIHHIPSKDYINGGFMVFKKEFLDYLKPGSMIEEAFGPLIEKGELSVFEHEGPWKAMDTYKDVEELNMFWEKDPFWKIWNK